MIGTENLKITHPSLPESRSREGLFLSLNIFIPSVANLIPGLSLRVFINRPGARAYSRRPLMSLMRERIVWQLQLTTPGSVSMTVCRNTSISSEEAATAWTWSLSFPVTR